MGWKVEGVGIGGREMSWICVARSLQRCNEKRDVLIPLCCPFGFHITNRTHNNRRKYLRSRVLESFDRPAVAEKWDQGVKLGNIPPG